MSPHRGLILSYHGRLSNDSQAFEAFATALGGRYRIERELGRGGMAAVFLARDVRHSRDVAIKVLRPDLAAALGAERFGREIETVAGLSHPHILALHDSGVANGLPYYVMPFVDGETLRARVGRERQLPVHVAVGIARDVADALAHAHRHGIVHRDIKPENVLLQGSHALVADFGIALAVERAGAERMTQTGVSVGTPAYMSPEQATGERETDGRSDIYSLGCVLYEMLTGEPPFAGPTAQAVITKRMTGPPPSVRRLRPSVNASLDAVVGRAMAPAPADRFQTAGDLLEALTRAASDVGGLTRRPSKGRIVAVLSGVAAVMAIAAGAFLWRSRPALPASASSIVVLPPTPVSADTSLARLGRELAITMSASLDGVGGIRVADALGVLANVDASGPALSLEQARTLAQRFGARSVVRGTLIRVGDSVRVDVSLHPTACTSGECTQPLARAVASAPIHDITRLTDETTWALLRGVWQREGAPTPSLTAVTTRSIPALRAFLEGERDIVEGRWRAAPAAYERAFTEDSTFLLAYWRYAFARSYWHETVDPAIRAKYRENRGRFPPRDRMLIEAELADSMSVRYARTKAAAERFPEYWPAWWVLSERLAHETPLIGTTSRDLRAALEHTLALNPRMTSAWEHLFWPSTWERDTALARRVLQQLALLRFDTVSLQEVGFDELAHYRYIADGITGDGTPRDTVVRQFGAGILAAMPASIDPMMLGLGITQYSLGREQVAMSARVLARHPAPAVAAGHYLAAAVAQASRGAWDSSLVALDGYIARVTDPAAPVYAYRMAVVGAWLGALTPEAAVARRASAVRDSVSLPAARRAELAWLDGILAVTNRDANALTLAQRALRGADSVSAPMLERSLAAFADALSGERDRAADSLVALERERAERGLSRRASDAHPFLTAVDRLAAARWLQERGKSGDAARLLSWFEAVLVPMRATRQANAAVEGLAYLERARVAESLGAADVARDYYRRFLVRYDAPTQLHRHLVVEANQALTRLGAATADRPRQ